MSNIMKYKKILISLTLVVITIVLVIIIVKNPPTGKRTKASQAAQMTVATTTITPQNYQIMVQSFGTVQPRTQSVLFSQVSGQITHISKQFRDGGFFEKGDVLVQLDDRDYRAEVKISQASLLSAKQALLEEQARGEQALTDWKRLGNNKQPSALVLRQPQYESAKALVLSAEAQLDKVKLSLERTQIVAPYAGRILKKNVDIGQVVSSSTQLADIFAVDYVEIRLPIKNKDLPLMVLPEEYHTSPNTLDEDESDDSAMISNVVISSDLMGKQVWQGKVVRTESAIDESSQQLYVVAQIISPYDKKQNPGAQIKMGQYVTATITGLEVENALVIPSSAIYQGSYVYIVQDGLLMRKEVQLGWQNGTESIVKQGLLANDELVLTSLGQVSSGTPVAIEGQENTQKKANDARSKDNKREKDPAKRLDKLKKIAMERGISVEDLIAEREKNRSTRNTSNQTLSSSKVNH